jgi:hypothetical protein
MILYRIRRKSDGKFLQGGFPRTKGSWGPSGALFKQAKTIQKHLKELCSEFIVEETNYGCYIKLVNTDKRKLKLFDVVETHVSVNGEKTIDALSFADTSKWKEPKND